MDTNDITIDIDAVTREDFIAYEQVRRSGKINMCDIELVEMMSILDKEQIICIQRNYKELSKKFPIDEEEWEPIP